MCFPIVCFVLDHARADKTDDAGFLQQRWLRVIGDRPGRILDHCVVLPRQPTGDELRVPAKLAHDFSQREWFRREHGNRNYGMPARHHAQHELAGAAPRPIALTNTHSLLYFQRAHHAKRFWKRSELSVNSRMPSTVSATNCGHNMSSPLPFRKIPRMITKK